MLRLYYARPSACARPVWLMLLEKGLDFELVPVDLRGHQLRPDFLAVNPFGHVPVLVDGDLRVIESLAILDYLEARYPRPSLLPTTATEIATVRMVQLVTLNELLPALLVVLQHPSGEPLHRPEVADAHRQIAITLAFFEQLLGNRPYIASTELTLGDIVAGSLIYRLPSVGISFDPYPRLAQWSERLCRRSSWQAIELEPQEWQHFQGAMQRLPKLWAQQRQRMASQGINPTGAVEGARAINSAFCHAVTHGE